MTPMIDHPTQQRRAGWREWCALAVLMLPVLVLTLDNTVLSFAIPHLSAALSPSATQLLWIVDVYPLCLAGLLVTMGTLGDRWGRRRLLLIGAFGFGVVGLYAAFAPSAGHLIAARALRGVFGATLMPSTLSLLRTLFVVPEQRRLAIAIWGSGFAGGSAIGPIFGGWLLDHYWWGSIFLFTMPLIVVLLGAAPFVLPESREGRTGPLDWISVVLSLVAMVPFVFGLKDVAVNGPSLPAASALGVGVAVAVVFVRRQTAHEHPLLDVSLFRNPVFSASIVGNFFSIFAFVGLTFSGSQYLQLVVGLDAFSAGLRLIPGALTSILVGLLAARLARFFPLHVLVPVGIALAALGHALAVALHPTTTQLVFVAAFVLISAGAGLAETLTNDAILAAVPARSAGAAAGLSETAYELGAALGVAVLGSVLTAVYRTHLDLPPGLDAARADQAGQSLAAADAATAGLPSRLAGDVLTAAREAFMTGVEVSSGAAALVMTATALIVARTLRQAHRAAERGE